MSASVAASVGVASRVGVIVAGRAVVVGVGVGVTRMITAAAVGSGVGVTGVGVGLVPTLHPHRTDADRRHTATTVHRILTQANMVISLYQLGASGKSTSRTPFDDPLYLFSG